MAAFVAPPNRQNPKMPFQQWKKKLMEGASDIFQSKAERKESKPYTEDDLMKKIGRLEIENDFLRSVSLACGLNPEKLK